MRRSLIPVLTGLGLCLAQMTANAQEFKQHITREFTQQKGVVAIYNLNGPVKVEGYNGTKVIVEIDETISGDDQQGLEEGKKEFKLGFDQQPDSLVAYTAEPYDTRPHRGRYNNNNYDHPDYEVKLEYTVKVPSNVKLYVSTVNHGNIIVKDVYGTLKVNNVNGSIEIINAKGTTSAHTVNGPVTVNYLSVPPDESSYYTVNGEMNVTFPASFSANLQFKSLNGQFYTDFNNAELMPSKVTKTQSSEGGTTVYKLNKASDVRIGAGGKTFKFQTLNGNIYIKKQS
jgi:DUF4097 and DUF4098 domain-containing protein YvlB